MNARTCQRSSLRLAALGLLAGASALAAAWLWQPTGATAQGAPEVSHFDGALAVRTTSVVNQDTQFVVGVAPVAGAHADCSAARSVTATIRTGRSHALVEVAALVASPAGETTACEYELSWPSSEAGGTVWVDDASHPSEVVLSAERAAATRRYRLAADTTFAPAVSVTVPQIERQLDRSVTGENLFAGTQITVTFVRAPNADPGCSAGTPVSATYTVGVDGRTTGEHPTPLIDRPARGNSPCVYVFDADREVSSAASEPLRWTLTRTTVTGTFAATSPLAQVAYSVGDVTFEPDVTIEVPQIAADATSDAANVFAALTFDVGFAATAASPPGCSDVAAETYAYEVQPDGTVTGAPPSLVDRVVETAGDGTQSTSTAACAYEVTFAAQSADRAWLALSATPGLTDNETSADAPDAGATYDFAGISSAVDLMVTTPAFTPPPERVVSASISAADGAAAGCLVDDLANQPAATATKAVTLEADGSTTLAQQFRLVDVAASAANGDERCTYDVAWSESDTSDPAPAIWTFDSGDTAWVPSGDLGAAGLLSATYVEPVAEPFDATLELIVVSHVPEATAFTVEVAPTTSSPTGCTAADTHVLAAPALDGTNDRRATATIELAHTVAGDVRHCAYAVGWPDDEDGAGTSFVADGSFTAGVSLSRDNPSATNRYADATQQLTFTASLTVVTSQPVTEDTVFVVDVVASSGSLAGCESVDDYELELLAASQTPTQVTQTLELVRRPAAATQECAFTLSWDEHEKDGTAWAPDATFAAQAVLSSDAASATNRYAPAVSYFTPSLTLQLPALDFDGDGCHDYAGARLEVSFERSADEACSPSETATYEIDAAGGVAPVGPFELIDEHPAGACTYGVEFPPTIVDADAGTLVVVAAPSDNKQVSADANDARATYGEAVTRFDAHVYLGGTHTVAPDGRLGEVVAAGTTFSVLVRPQRGAPAGCDADPTSRETSRRVTLAMVDALDQRPYTRLSERTLAGLVDRTGDGEACVYDVIWPVNEVGGTSYVRDVAGQFANTVRAGNSYDARAVAWYRDRINAPSSFPGSVRVRLSAAASVDLHFAVVLDPLADPAGCSAQRRLTVTVGAGETLGVEAVPDLVARPAGSARACEYDVTWPLYESGGTSYARDATFADADETLTNIAGVARHQFAPVRRPPPSTGGGSGGSGSGGASSGGGSGGRVPSGGSGTGSGGGQPGSPSGSPGSALAWRLTGELAPVTLTVAMPERLLLPGDTTIELRVHSVGACADDLDAFGGVPAEVGLIYAVRAESDVAADVLAGAALRFASSAERGDETRDCELRVTLLRAPIGCQLQGARQDTEGRLYVSLTPDDQPTFSDRLSLGCVAIPPALAGFTLSCILYDECWNPDVTPDVTGITFRCLATGTCRP